MLAPSEPNFGLKYGLIVCSTISLDCQGIFDLCQKNIHQGSGKCLGKETDGRSKYSLKKNNPESEYAFGEDFVSGNDRSVRHVFHGPDCLLKNPDYETFRQKRCIAGKYLLLGMTLCWKQLSSL